uniref:Ig-like domain-containing protein n=1 Tax=Oreochromis aureus TaxID=47969 RepID=A0AAZ1XK47_OREAU
IFFRKNKCASDTKSANQTPPSIIKRIGESVQSEFKCSHSIPSYDVILWYKQDEKGVLQLLGYLNVEYPNIEDDVKGKISFDGNGRKHSNLTISNVSVTDSAVYFCAASQHSTTDSTKVNTKTSPNVSDRFISEHLQPVCNQI